MNPDLLALAEPLLVFGLLVVFIHWQFRELRQRAEARAKDAREQAAREAAEDAAGEGRPPSDDPPRHPPG